MTVYNTILEGFRGGARQQEEPLLKLINTYIRPDATVLTDENDTTLIETPTKERDGQTLDDLLFSEGEVFREHPHQGDLHLIRERGHFGFTVPALPVVQGLYMQSQDGVRVFIREDILYHAENRGRVCKEAREKAQKLLGDKDLRHYMVEGEGQDSIKILGAGYQRPDNTGRQLVK